jgi:hypothetical protein
MCGAQNKLNRPTTENRTFKKFGLRPLGRSKTCGKYRMSKKVSYFSFFSQQPFFVFGCNKQRKVQRLFGKETIKFYYIIEFQAK